MKNNNTRIYDWDKLKANVYTCFTLTEMAKIMDLPLSTLKSALTAEFGMNYEELRKSILDGDASTDIQIQKRTLRPVTRWDGSPIIEWLKVENLFAGGYSVKSVAKELGISTQDLSDRCSQEKGIPILVLQDESYELGGDQIKKKMFDLAMSGHANMLIWLSKNRLGYSEKVEEKVESTVATKVNFNLLKTKLKEMENDKEWK